MPLTEGATGPSPALPARAEPPPTSSRRVAAVPIAKARCIVVPLPVVSDPWFRSYMRAVTEATGDAALDGHDVPFDRGPGAVGDDGDPMSGARPDHLGHLRARRREDHTVRGRGVVGGIVPAVLVPDGLAGAAPLLESVAEALQELRRGAASTGNRGVCGGLHASPPPGRSQGGSG